MRLGGNEWVRGPSSAIISCDHYFNFLSIGLSRLTVKVRVCGSQAPHGSDRRFLRDESQSSHGNLDLLHFFLHCCGVGVGKEWNRYRLGHPAVEVLTHAPPLNVQSGHSKVLHQGSSRAAMGPHP